MGGAGKERQTIKWNLRAGSSQKAWKRRSVGSEPHGSTTWAHNSHKGGFPSPSFCYFLGFKFFPQMFTSYFTIQFFQKLFWWGDPEKIGVSKWPEVLSRKQSLLPHLLLDDFIKNKVPPIPVESAVCFLTAPPLSFRGIITPGAGGVENRAQH